MFILIFRYFLVELVTPGCCRICLQPDEDESNKCISPCLCRGTISKVHQICLESWLRQTNFNGCEICSWKYKTKRVYK